MAPFTFLAMAFAAPDSALDQQVCVHTLAMLLALMGCTHWLRRPLCRATRRLLHFLRAARGHSRPRTPDVLSEDVFFLSAVPRCVKCPCPQPTHTSQCCWCASQLNAPLLAHFEFGGDVAVSSRTDTPKGARSPAATCPANKENTERQPSDARAPPTEHFVVRTIAARRANRYCTVSVLHCSGVASMCLLSFAAGLPRRRALRNLRAANPNKTPRPAPTLKVPLAR